MGVSTYNYILFGYFSVSLIFSGYFNHGQAEEVETDRCVQNNLIKFILSEIKMKVKRIFM